jgi:hypothetical protein
MSMFGFGISGCSAALLLGITTTADSISTVPVFASRKRRCVDARKTSCRPVDAPQCRGAEATRHERLDVWRE